MGNSVPFSGHHPFVLPSTKETRDFIILVKVDTPSSNIETLILCGDCVESLAIEILQAEGLLWLYSVVLEASPSPPRF